MMFLESGSYTEMHDFSRLNLVKPVLFPDLLLFVWVGSSLIFYSIQDPIILSLPVVFAVPPVADVGKVLGEHVLGHGQSDAARVLWVVGADPSAEEQKVLSRRSIFARGCGVNLRSLREEFWKHID